MKTLITTALAATMMATVSNAAIISNGGKPDITLTEIQQKLDAGEFQQYPGVVRLTATGTRYTAAGNNYLFKKTFKPGMALPRVVDMTALQRAVAQSDVILVASRDLILPTPTIFVELAKQNGVDPVAFMQHYIEATTEIDSDAFGVHAKAQTMAALKVLGLEPQGITVDVDALVAAGVAELEAERLAHLATQVALQEAVRTVAELTESESRLAATLTSITAELSTIQSHWQMPEATAPEQLRVINEEMHRLHAEVSRQTTLVQVFRSIAEARGLTIDQLTLEKADLIAERNDLITERDIANYNLNRQILATRDAHFTSARLQAQVDSLRDDLRGLNARIANLATTREITTSTTTAENGITTFTNGSHTHRYNASNLAGEHITAHGGTVFATIAGSHGSRMGDTLMMTIMAQVSEAITDAYEAGYNQGYNDGYNAGYADGYADGVASAQ